LIPPILYVEMADKKEVFVERKTKGYGTIRGFLDLNGKQEFNYLRRI
jgi:hypothetical protein